MSSPTWGPYPQTSYDDATSDVGLVDPSFCKKGRRSQGNRGSRGGKSWDGSHSTRSTTSSGGRRKKKDEFSCKIQIPEFGGKKGHSGDVTDAFRQWARCITYYRDYYEDSYLMPLVVSSLTGDASDVLIGSLASTMANLRTNNTPPNAERTLLWFPHL